MRIPARSDYALRATVRLAGSEGAFRSAEELAAAEGIPCEYLQNILRDLRRAGLLHAQRGHDGGFRLARPAQSIRVVDVLDAVGSPLTERYACAPAVIWDELEDSMRAVLSATTIADLVHAGSASPLR